jgi:hypothetical protein
MGGGTMSISYRRLISNFRRGTVPVPVTFDPPISGYFLLTLTKMLPSGTGAPAASLYFYSAKTPSGEELLEMEVPAFFAHSAVAEVLIATTADNCELMAAFTVFS